MQQVIYPPFSVWLSAFLQSVFFSGLLVFVGESLFVGLIMWAESRAGDDRPIRTRTVLR